MAEAVVTVIFNKLNSYLIDLGIVSQVVSDKVLSKVKTTARDSILSSLQDYAKQGSSELDEKLERLKKQPIIDRLNYLYGDNTFSGRYGIDIIKVCVVIFIFMSAVTYFQIQISILAKKLT